MEEIIVFGIGRYFQSKKENLEKKYKIVGFLDNAVKPGIPEYFDRGGGKDMSSGGFDITACCSDFHDVCQIL